jgi:glycosyltransferase involved in cell wall biosynthesis
MNHAAAERGISPREAPLVPKRWLILSHAFNMDGRAASQTITDKIPTLLEHGIQLSVISAITGEQDVRFPHDRLLPWGPAGLRFDFRHWMAQKVGRGLCYRLVTTLATVLLAPLIVVERLALGLSSQWSWAIPAALRGWRVVRSGSVQLVYSTGGAWSAHLAGWWIKKLTGVLWIAEIHDPLVAPHQQQMSRDARAKRWLETKICTDADLVWWFTEAALASARKRNPQLGEKGFAVLAGTARPPVKAQHVYTDTLNIGHFGVLSPTRSLVPFLEAFASFCKKNPLARQNFRLHVYGTALDMNSAHAAKTLALDDIVIAHGRIEKDLSSGLSGRDRVLQQMQRSDALLLLHGAGPGRSEAIPSKLYEYFWSGRPVFAVTRDNLQLEALVRDRNGYVCCTTDQESIAQSIERLWEDWNDKALAPNRVPPIDIEVTVARILRTVNQICA